MKTAIVIGATGLVGKALVQLLLADVRFERVVVFVRRSTRLQHQKLEEHIINFDAAESWRELVKGDVLFSALGTTIKQAGGKEQQYKIDYTYQYNFAVAAAGNGVPRYVLVSSSGANPMSRIFYSRMKGELEEAAKRLHFKSIYLLQPSLLVGERQEKRAGEEWGYRVLKFLNGIGILKKYRPIEGRVVAQAMLQAALQPKPGVHMVTLEEVFNLAEYG